LIEQAGFAGGALLVGQRSIAGGRFQTIGDAKTKHEEPAWIDGKDRRLEVMSAAPLVLAAPVSLVAGQRITDKSVLFIRNIHDLPEGLSSAVAVCRRRTLPGVQALVDQRAVALTSNSSSRSGEPE
jgi:hypothetical protein